MLLKRPMNLQRYCWRALAILFIFIVSENGFAQNTPNVCKTNAIYSLNGFLTAPEDAQANSDLLQHLIKPNLSDQELQATEFDYIYNDTQSFNDILETLLASRGLSNSRFYRALAGLDVLPNYVQDYFHDLAYQSVFDANALDQTTLLRVRDRSKVAIQQGKRVVVVAHSQGNLYSNSVWSLLTDVEKQFWATVNVAVPDSQVDGSLTGYTTLLLDQVIYPIDAIARAALVLQPPVIPNVSDDYVNPFARVLNHSFTAAYLANEPSRSQIVQNTLSTMRSLSVPSSCSRHYVYLTQFGTYGSGNAEFQEIRDVAIDPISHDIFVTDIQFVKIFNSAGVYQRKFSWHDDGDGVGAPMSVAIDPTSHNIVVANAGMRRVQIFNSAGVYLNTFESSVPAFGTIGSGDNGRFAHPAGIAIDPTSHNIVVVDSGSSLLYPRVEIFDSAGNYLSQFGISAQLGGNLGSPFSVAIDPTNHNILVGDGGLPFGQHPRVLIFNSAGVYLSEIGTFGSGDGQLGYGQLTALGGITIDPTSGDIVVTDSGNNRAQIFSSAGVYLSQFGESGSADGQFNLPLGIAMDPTSGNLVVVDHYNNRVQIFAPASSP